jgi:hypothetical protein
MDWAWGKEVQFRSDIVPQVGLQRSNWIDQIETEVWCPYKIEVSSWQNCLLREVPLYIFKTTPWNEQTFVQVNARGVHQTRNFKIIKKLKSIIVNSHDWPGHFRWPDDDVLWPPIHGLCQYSPHQLNKRRPAPLPPKRLSAPLFKQILFFIF